MARVILADDEEQIRVLVHAALVRAGHDVTDAADGTAALEELNRRPADIMLLDVGMPGVDGWSVLEQVKSAADPLISDTPVVMLTGSGDTHSRVRAAVEGAIGYISKPFLVKQLVKQVDDVLEGDPEPLERRRVQQEALRALVRMDGGRFDSDTPHVNLTALEHRRPVRPQPTPPAPLAIAATGQPFATGSDHGGALTATAIDVSCLPPRQQEVLKAVSSSPSLERAAQDLGISTTAVRHRLNASAKKLGLSCTAELLAHTGPAEAVAARPTNRYRGSAYRLCESCVRRGAYLVAEDCVIRCKYCGTLKSVAV